ncbi:LuxR family transcriptional regulator [Caenimonas sedimenti]|uniref:LuxR family transcriptional regulator n=1 Tax=Caenimonas sedimenti TaxID=2596921 RepID=A0A562ZXV1_9BURK|nr:LuxR family transcriptional regulator [Caenimonas sedimenti]TWO73216.1 LuxR family transcriptional regulator [Caenimonas sedimenti]
MKDAAQLSQIASMTAAVDEADFLQKAQAAARAIGFEHVLLGFEWRRHSLPPIQHVTSGFPAGYQQVYVERGLIMLDPTVPYCQTHTQPLEWDEAMYTSPQSREVLEESRKYGLSHGLSVPVHESGSIASMLSLGRDKPFESDSEREVVMAGGSVLANCAHVVIKRVLFPAFAAQLRARLTKRELECLQWIAQGKSNTVIADILRISENAVEYHLKSLFPKLKVSTRVQAAIVAVEMSLV